MWRIFPAIAGISFLSTGIGAIRDPDCVSASLGGTRRLIEFTCYGNDWEGSMDARTLGELISVAGVLLLLLAAWPLVRAVFPPTSSVTAPYSAPANTTVRSPSTDSRRPTSGIPAQESPTRPDSPLRPPPSTTAPKRYESTLPPPAASTTPSGLAPNTGPDSDAVNWTTQLREIGALRDDGLLTADEFEAEKQRTLPNSAPRPQVIQQDGQRTPSNWMQQLKAIGRLRDDGLLTEGEFQTEKTRILRDKDL